MCAQEIHHRLEYTAPKPRVLKYETVMDGEGILDMPAADVKDTNPGP
jgi:hypothetical protein